MDNLVSELLGALGKSLRSGDARPSRRVPMEIAEMVVNKMALEDVMEDGVVENMFPNLDMSETVSNRKSVRRYLSAFTSDVDGLVEVMLVTNSFISGSRAAAFFLPEASDEGSDWDVYCCGTEQQRMMLLEWMMKNKFEVLAPQSEPSPTTLEEIVAYRNAGLSVLHGRMKTPSGDVSVQLIRPQSFTDVETVLSFHSSVVQCFISGYGAVSVMSKVTRMSKSVEWNTEHELEGDKSRHDVAVGKYKRRGIEYIGKEEYKCMFGERISYCMGDCNPCLVRIEYHGPDKEKFERIAKYRRDISMSVQWVQTFGSIFTDRFPKYELAVSMTQVENTLEFREEFVRRVMERGALRMRGDPPENLNEADVRELVENDLTRRSMTDEIRKLGAGEKTKSWIYADSRPGRIEVGTDELLKIRKLNWMNIITGRARAKD